MLAYEIIGIPAAERTALAPIEAPEQAAPATATTPASTRACAAVEATVPSQPESSSTSSKSPPAALRSAMASAAAKVNPGAKFAIGPVIGFRNPIFVAVEGYVQLPSSTSASAL